MLLLWQNETKRKAICIWQCTPCRKAGASLCTKTLQTLSTSEAWVKKPDFSPRPTLPAARGKCRTAPGSPRELLAFSLPWAGSGPTLGTCELIFQQETRTAGDTSKHWARTRGPWWAALIFSFAWWENSSITSSACSQSDHVCALWCLPLKRSCSWIRTLQNTHFLFVFSHMGLNLALIPLKAHANTLSDLVQIPSWTLSAQCL